MSKISWWSKFCALPRFSFLLAEGPSVRKVHDTCGNWIDQSAVSQIVDDMQAEINALRERLERLKPEGARSSVPQDVEEFIAAESFYTPEYPKSSGHAFILVDDLRAWMTGHVRVPVEPTEEMIEAGCKQHECQQQDTWYSNSELSEYDCKAIYKAMLSASKGE